MSKQRTLTTAEVKDWLSESRQKTPYKIQGHSFIPLKGVGKQYCKNCGLLALNNKFTQWCVDKGCNYEDHKQYVSTKKRLTKMKW